jgi:serine O-acetyltransferase
MFENLRQDTRRLRETTTKPFPWYVVESALFDAGYQAVVLHRLAAWLKRHRVPALPAAIARWNQLVTGADLSPHAEIGPGLRIAHPSGIVVGWRTRIGRDCLLLQNVTLGAPATGRREEMPTVGDRVMLAAGCAVIGSVRVGDDAVVGALALVTEDVPANAKVLARGGVEVRPRRSAAEAGS